jgi:tetratricopeptide (TPR) repeat protein
MLGGRTEEAVETGSEAIRLADLLGLDELKAQALNNIGSARGNSGEPGAMEDLHEGLELARRINSVPETLRGLNNLAAQYVMRGELREAQATLDELRELAERYGYLGFLRFLDGGPEIANRYQRGEWDEALARADAFLAEVEAGSPHYQAPAAYCFRAMMRLARDDEAGARSDAARSRELVAQAGDPQAIFGSLVMDGLVYEGAGDKRAAAEVLDDVLDGLGKAGTMGWAVVVSTGLAWLARVAGRADDLAPMLRREAVRSRWLEAADAVLEGKIREAADVLGEIGARPLEAYFRLRLAESLVDEGRRAEADEQLHAALAFYRGVGATRFLREGEALLAASA